MSERDNRKRVEELTLSMIDAEASAEELEELQNLVSSDDEGARIHLALLEQEATLRGTRRGVDVREGTMERVKRALEDRVEGKVMTKVHSVSNRIEPELAWLGGRRFWQVLALAAAVLLVIGGAWLRAVHPTPAAPQEAFLYGQPEASPGQHASYRVFVRNARSDQPIANATVFASLRRPDGSEGWRGDVKTDADGLAVVETRLGEEAPEGDYSLEVRAQSAAGESTVTRGLKVRRSYRVMVATDKPIYQPGQTIAIRSLSLSALDLRPVESREVVIEVRDSKDNKVFKKRVPTSRFGIAATDFPLADLVNTGRYTVTAALGETVSERTITVEHYVLPRFRVDLETERSFYAPQDRVRVSLTAQYSFGQPVVNAQVDLVASEQVDELRPFLTLKGVTDSEGRVTLEVPLKAYHVGVPSKQGDAFVSVEATVTDAGGHAQKATRDLSVTTRPIRIVALPESGALVADVPNQVYLITAYPDGSPARTKLTLQPSAQVVETNEQGIGAITLTPHASGSSLVVEAVDDRGVKVSESLSLEVEGQPEAFLLRTDRAVYRAGETAHITMLGAGKGKGRVFVDLVKESQTMLVKAVDMLDGRGDLMLDLATDWVGTLELHAYRVLRDGSVVGDTRMIQVHRPQELTIEASLDKDSYRPGDEAILRLAVRNTDGVPVPAALGLSGVDEAVFALQEMRPGLERVFFQLQKELLQPRAEIHEVVLDPTALVERPTRGTVSRTEVILASAKASAPTVREASETYERRLETIREKQTSHLRSLAAACSLGLTAIFCGTAIPMLAYCLYRLFRREPAFASDEPDRKGLEKTFRWICIWWVAGLYLPFGGMGVGALGFSHDARDVAAIVIAAACAVYCLVMLVTWIRRMRSHPMSLAMPIFRKLLTGLPAGYVAVWVAVLFGFLSRSWAAGFAVAVMLVLTVTLVGGIAATGQSVLRPMSAGDWIAVAFSRILVAIAVPWVGIVIIAAIAMVVGVMGCASSEDSPLDLIRQAGELRALPTAVAPPSVTTAAAGPRIRKHFPETLIWRPEVITDERGEARVSIPLADSITTWRLSMSAVSASGALGADTRALRVFQPFFVDLDLPVSMTQNDRVAVPATVFNYLDKPQEVTLRLDAAAWFRLDGSATQTVKVPARSVRSVSFLLIAKEPGMHTLRLRAAAGEVGDAVERSVRVEPDGKPVTTVVNGTLDRTALHRFDLPHDAIGGASRLLVKIHPGTFSQVVEGMDGVLAMPSGCFEQTSSTTYPNVLVLDYMRRNRQVNPEIEMKAMQYIGIGYQRLLSFEVPGGGFEWFGKPPANAVLTAYGVMEFSDMARVHEVDARLIERTRTWLLGRQGGDGSFQLDKDGIAEGATNAYQDDKLRTTAYIAWALAESSGGGKEAGLGRALDYVAGEVEKQNDAYTLAVAANALVVAKHPAAARILGRLVEAKKADEKGVRWESMGEGVTFSRGEVLTVETTAIAVQALVRAGFGLDVSHRALQWLVAQKDEHGAWHSTQATVHALRALLLAMDGASQRLEKATEVALRLNGVPMETLHLTPDTSDVVHMASLGSGLRPGINEIALESVGSKLAYQLVETHYVAWPAKEAVEPTKPLRIDVAYDATKMQRNDLLKGTVTVAYGLPGTAQMVIVDLGIPAGFEVIPDSFDDLKDKGVIDRYTMSATQITLYVRSVASGKPLTFHYELRAKHPVRVKTPRSSTYLYYTPEVRDQTSPQEIVVL